VKEDELTSPPEKKSTTEVDPPPPKKKGRPKKRIFTLNSEKKEEKSLSIAPEISDLTVTSVPAPVPAEPKKEEEKDEDGIPTDASKWTPSQVEAYFKKHGLREEGALFREQEIDGLTLLLMNRPTILGMLVLGPALKVFKLITRLQQSGGVVDKELKT